jgi:hypothetical protein
LGGGGWAKSTAISCTFDEARCRDPASTGAKKEAVIVLARDRSTFSRSCTSAKMSSILSRFFTDAEALVSPSKNSLTLCKKNKKRNGEKKIMRKRGRKASDGDKEGSEGENKERKEVEEKMDKDGKGEAKREKGERRKSDAKEEEKKEGMRKVN